MTTNHRATTEGVRDAWDFWLTEHNISVLNGIDDVVRAAVKDWLDSHTDELITAIAKTIATENRTTP